MIPEESIQPGTPIQQLGAVPGTPTGVPGYDGNELGSDFAEFASSGEADAALRDYDDELTEDVLASARIADLASRELQNVGEDYDGYYAGED